MGKSDGDAVEELEVIKPIFDMGGYGLFVFGAVLFVLIGLYGIFQQSLIAFRRLVRKLKSNFEN